MLPLRWLSLGLVLGVIASSTASCGGAAKCSSSSCPFGCCDAAGSCQMTASDSQCGTNGAACTTCQLGTTCRLGQCAPLSGGGGSGGSGGGSSSGGGGGATGGGGGSSTGGGGGSTTDPVCTQMGVAQASFFGTRSTCPFVLQGTSTTVTLNANSNLASQCNQAIASCTTDDRTTLSTLASCLGSAPPCTAGNENTAGNAYFACVGQATGLSSACQAAISPGGTGGGGGSTGGGGGSTGGGGGSTGGGGGTTGGGGGTTGGGGGANCRAVTGLTLNPLGDYFSSASYESTFGSMENGTTAPVDSIGVELVWVDNSTPTNVTVPQTFDLAQQGTFNTCVACVSVCEDCEPNGAGCGQCYLARSGSVQVTQASRATPGSFAATVTNLRAEAWDLTADQPITGGGCVTVSSATISTTF